MTRVFSGVLLLVVAGCTVAIPDFRGGFDGFDGFQPAPEAPQAIAVPQSAKERFIATTAANGCQVNSANSALILEAATLSREDLARVMTELRAEGRGRIADDGTSFLLTTGECA
ncbi:hypothetical protein [Yoonia sp.]|uniref:hypothetical protein n=1 Tax=Yoonia sp. TaxID=2212373 RepID=UPI0035C7D711